MTLAGVQKCILYVYRTKRHQCWFKMPSTYGDKNAIIVGTSAIRPFTGQNDKRHIPYRQTAKRPFTGQNALYHPNGKMYLGQSQTEILACPTQVKAFV
jgi:hypothetical protein